MLLSDLAHRVGGALHGRDARVSGVSIDTRSLAPGELFVALPGQHGDGHDYLEAAASAGAGGALVARPRRMQLGQVQVADPRRALGRLAAGWRQGFDLPLVAVTGSNGKTTVKEMIAAILGRLGPVLATRGNLNNDLGVPLTLLRLGAEHRHAVIEMGANHTGEIDYLTQLARPRVAVLTNAGPAHLEGFGSIAGVVQAKGEIFNGLDLGGTAVINADDPHCAQWQAMAAGRRELLFGFSEAAAVRGHWQADASLAVSGPEAEFVVRLGLPGRHNGINALAAAAAALALGVQPADIAAGLAAVRPVAGRLQVKTGPAGSRLIDDSYNANPASVAAALDYLGRQSGETWLVLGDMAELGDAGPELHRQVGQQARRQGVSRLFAVGPLSVLAVAAFGEGGEHYAQVEQLEEALRGQLDRPLTVLFKGSRRAGLDRVVRALASPAREPG